MLVSIGAALLATLPRPTEAAAIDAPPSRPNVVLIMTDDQGIGDFGVMDNPVIETPEIDAMAARSASLATFYVSPVCSPTRASLLTGRYNYRTRCIDTFLGRSMMEPDEVTIAEVLSHAGYATGVFGKWHLGDCYPMRPIDQGFEQSLVHRGGGLAQPSEPPQNNRRYTNPMLFQNGQQVQTTGYCTDVYFDAALQFMRQAHAAGRKFFVYLPTNAPHGPVHDVPEDLRQHYMQKPKELAGLIVQPPQGDRLDSEIDTLARIAAMISNVDQNVGRLLRTLESMGIVDNTMVMFLVDNGPNTRRYVGNLRGKKSEVYEGGIRSPLWVHWPRRFPPGQIANPPAAHIDLMPTVLDACGVDPPADLRLDGRSLLPVLLRRNAPWPERTLVIQSHRGDRPVRYHHFMIRDPRFKLLHASGFGRETFSGEPELELYDILEDSGETNNLVDEKPEVVARLKAAYDRWFDDVSTTRPDNYAPPRIQVGSMHENPTVLTRQDWRGGTWDPDAVGHWQLYVARSGTYDVRLNFDPGSSQENLWLTLGSQSRQAAIAAGADSYQFSDLELTTGETQLKAMLTNGDKNRGVYQVVVTRKGGSDGSS
jgi:arylsulfatase/arylsulfatase A